MEATMFTDIRKITNSEELDSTSQSIPQRVFELYKTSFLNKDGTLNERMILTAMENIERECRDQVRRNLFMMANNLGHGNDVESKLLYLENVERDHKKLKASNQELRLERLQKTHGLDDKKESDD